MRRFNLIGFVILIGAAAGAAAQSTAPRAGVPINEWHTAEWPGRQKFIWSMLSREFTTSFPRGGSPVAAGPFWQDDCSIHELDDAEYGKPLALLSAGEEAAEIQTDKGSYKFKGGKFIPGEKDRQPTQTLLNFDGDFYRVNGQTLERGPEKGPFSPVVEFGRNGLPDGEVRDIAISPDGLLYAATASGIGIMRTKGKWTHLTGRDGGLPVNDVNCLSFAPDGTLWVGTKIGAARRNPNGAWSYRMGARWMSGDEVLGIRATENGGAWILTSESLTQLQPRRMTLREKAKLYDKITQERHVRHGAVTGCLFREGDNPDSWYMTDNDNDGLWTSIYMAAKCFEYGATGDPEAKRLAKIHFDFLERLETINGIPGYISRSLRPDSFVPDSHEKYNYSSKGEWHESTVEPGWQWKSDTSSDEICGHYFAYGVYYDLIARGDAAEEERVQNLVRRVTNFIIDHDFAFVDVDGKPTRWAVYSPKMLKGDLLWSDEVGFNALGILAHLKVAIRICGDQKFKDAYHKLIDEDQYNVKAMFAKEMIPNNPFANVNHSDDEMAWLYYYHLLLYPDEDENLAWQYRYSAVRSMRIVVDEQSPFFNFPFAVQFPEWAHVADGIETLKRWPLDLREFGVKNSQRDDLIRDPKPNRAGRATMLNPIPADERQPTKWNSDPYVADYKGSAKSEEDGGAWLLPYWMGVYHGLIVEKES